MKIYFPDDPIKQEMIEALIEAIKESKKCQEMCYQYWPPEEKVEKWENVVERAIELKAMEVAQ